MDNKKKSILVLALILNSIVLLGQIWPEGAPPFARIVNILTLLINLFLVFFALLQLRKSNKQ